MFPPTQPLPPPGPRTAPHRVTDPHKGPCAHQALRAVPPSQWWWEMSTGSHFVTLSVCVTWCPGSWLLSPAPRARSPAQGVGGAAGWLWHSRFQRVPGSDFGPTERGAVDKLRQRPWLADPHSRGRWPPGLHSAGPSLASFFSVPMGTQSTACHFLPTQLHAGPGARCAAKGSLAGPKGAAPCRSSLSASGPEAGN